MYWLPESPRWLLMNDRYDEAQRNLLKLHTPEEAAVELAQIHAQMQIDRTLRNSYWIMFKKPSYRKRTLLAIGTTCSIQFSGILVINNYGPTIYAGLGYDTERQLLLLGAWLTLAFGCGVLALLVVDRMPRPKLIGGGIAGCMVALIIEAALVANYANSTNTAALKAAVAMIFIYVVFYEIALDGVRSLRAWLSLIGRANLSSESDTIRLRRRTIPHTSSSQGYDFGCRWYMSHECYVAAGCTHCFPVSL